STPLEESDTFAEQPEGIDAWDYSAQDNAPEYQDERAFFPQQAPAESAEDHEDTADDKELAAQPVSAVPVLRAVQRPGDLYADSVVLLKLRHIISQYDK